MAPGREMRQSLMKTHKQRPDSKHQTEQSTLRLSSKPKILSSIGNREMQRLLGVESSINRSESFADFRHRIQSRSEGMIQREDNELDLDGKGARPLKDEIRQQYTGEPDPQFNELWSAGTLSTINQQQSANNKLPTYAHAKISKLPEGNRPGNPNSIKVHGYEGNEEAKLRGDITSNPYDGGHLVGWQFLGNPANTYMNAAAQGKNLDNGPFSLWENKVFAQAIKNTARLLESIGVTDMPHLFDYKVRVTYDNNPYFIGRNYLVKYGLIPPADMGKLPLIVSLTKRIPIHWEAYAQPLAFPDSKELASRGAKKGLRPDTPYIFTDVFDYGMTNQGEGSGNFSARGPAHLVGELYSEDQQQDKLSRTIESIQKRGILTDFPFLQGKPQDVAARLNNAPFKSSAYLKTTEDAQALADKLGKKPRLNKSIRGATFMLFNAAWRGQAPEAMDTKIDEAKKDPSVNPKEVYDFILDSLEVLRLLQKMLTPSGDVRTNDAGTIDFSSPAIHDEGLFSPDLADFRFSANETQPD